MPTLQELANDFCKDEEIQYVELTSQKISSLGEINIGENKSFFTKLKNYPYEFEINSLLQLASIDGTKLIATKENENSKVDEKIEQLEQKIKTINEKIETLENETIVNKREKILQAPVEIPVTTKILDANKNVELKKVTGENASIEEYKFLEIQVDVHWTASKEENHLENTMFIAVDQLEYNNSDTVNWGNNSTFNIWNEFLSENKISYCGTIAWFKDNKTLHLGGATGSTRSDFDKFRIRNIYGIK